MIPAGQFESRANVSTARHPDTVARPARGDGVCGEVVRSSPQTSRAIVPGAALRKPRTRPTGLTPVMIQVKAMVAASGDGPSPSYAEMAAWLGFKSKGYIHRTVEHLVARGHLVRGPARSRRTLRVVVHCCPHCGGELDRAPVSDIATVGEPQ